MSELSLFEPFALPFVPAVISPCERYRYELRREVEPGSWSRGPLALWCGANPSTAAGFDPAGKLIDDPTIRKERGFSRLLGCGGFIKLNLAAWRSTKPGAVPKDLTAIGPDNARHIADALAEPRVQYVIAAWGDCLIRHPLFRAQVEQFVLATAASGRPVQCLSVVKSGQPGHPLMLPYSAQLSPWWVRVTTPLLERAGEVQS